MTDEDLTKLAKIQSLVASTHESIAKIEAMKCFNDHRRSCDQSPGYAENDFYQEAEVLNTIASKLTEFF
jgi:hypothetical protein